jgi:hypothetical protein
MPKIYSVLLSFTLLFLLSCAKKEQKSETQQINSLAENYVRLGLTIGQYDADFVDAYYGPDSLKPASSKSDIFPKDSLLNLVTELRNSLKNSTQKLSDTNKVRTRWMLQQLLAFDRRIRIYSGEFKTFDEESKELFGISAPVYTEEHYKLLLDSLNKLLPGNGSVQDRFQNLANRFIIPENKLDTIFKTTIAEARKSTKAYYRLPETETFTIEYVKDKPWSGYNWYKGNYTSVIQINTDTRIFIERAIDVGSHESYPGHHVYNMLLEKNLYQDKGWVEISLYPLFSPQSFIAEGSANYGINLVFPGNRKVKFAKEILLPLAKLDTAYITNYFHALAIRGKLNYARNEAARGIVNQTMTDKQALEWLMNYCLYNKETALKSISFIKKYRSYVINYNYGQDLVRKYIESNAIDPKKRWDVFGKLLSNPVLPEELLIN